MPPKLLSSIPYGSYLVYSPRGTSAESVKSRRVRDAVKYGREDILRKIALRLSQTISVAGLSDFLGEDVTLIPVPRSAPLIQGALWPAHAICDELVRANLGREIKPILTRSKAVGKSAFAARGERPTIREHFDTMEVIPELISGASITLVDDIITKGSTLLASARRIQEAYPEYRIGVFALVRTMGLIPDIERIEEPATGIVSTYFGQGNREP